MNDPFDGLNPDHCQDGNTYLQERLKDPQFKIAYEVEGVRIQIAEKILERRRALHLTQKQLADRAMTGQKVISRIERAEISVGVDLLQRVVKALGGEISVDMNFAHPA